MSVWSSTAAWTRTSTICPASHRPLCSSGTPTPGPSYGAASAASCSDKRSLADICTRSRHIHTQAVFPLFYPPLHLFSTIYHCATSICLLRVFYFQCFPLHVHAVSPRVSVFQRRADYCSYLMDLLTAVETVLCSAK